MTSIIASIVQKARNAAAAKRAAAGDRSLSEKAVKYLIAEADELESYAALAEGNNYIAIKWICGELGLTADWRNYLIETSRDPFALEHQLVVENDNPAPAGADGDDGMSGGPP